MEQYLIWYIDTIFIEKKLNEVWWNLDCFMICSNQIEITMMYHLIEFANQKGKTFTGTSWGKLI